MKLTSPDFQHNEMMPAKFTCQGEDVSPALEIADIPRGTESLALILDDPDAVGGMWDHWIVFNISPIGTVNGDSAPGTQGKNSWGRNDYGGPCPPKGTGAHRYCFKLYALDTTLDLPAGVSKNDLERTMKGHVLAEAQLIGLYEKS